jgi:thiamine biosynthesis lipoprotein
VIRRCRPGLGTFVEVSLLDDARDGDAGVAAAFAAVDRVGALMSFHDPASELSTINRDAATRPVPVDRWTFDVLAAAADLFGRTDGRFDCAVAPVLIEEGLLPAVVPATTRHGSFADVVLDAEAHTIAFRVPLCLDLGGIAKGFAVDRAIDALRRHGVARAVVNAGGDLRVLGDRAVPIHLRPLAPDALPIRIGDLADGAFAASAGVRSAAQAPGALVDAHARRVIDEPRVYAVIAPTCLVADAMTKVVARRAPGWEATLRGFDATALIH